MNTLNLHNNFSDIDNNIQHKVNNWLENEVSYMIQNVEILDSFKEAYNGNFCLIKFKNKFGLIKDIDSKIEIASQLNDFNYFTRSIIYFSKDSINNVKNVFSTQFDRVVTILSYASSNKTEIIFIFDKIPANDLTEIFNDKFI